MADHCNHGSCSHDHHHDHCNTCGSDHCHCHEHRHAKYSDQLLELADEAWMEVLKDKIKEQIIKTSGKNLDEMAKLVSEANHARWKYKMEEFANKAAFDERLHELLNKPRSK